MNNSPALNSLKTVDQLHDAVKEFLELAFPSMEGSFRFSGNSHLMGSSPLLHVEWIEGPSIAEVKSALPAYFTGLLSYRRHFASFDDAVLFLDAAAEALGIEAMKIDRLDDGVIGSNPHVRFSVNLSGASNPDMTLMKRHMLKSFLKEELGLHFYEKTSFAYS